jgi:ankyrin repeat protein
MRNQPRRILTSALIWRLVGCLVISWSLAAGLHADAAATTLLDAVRRGDVDAVRVQIASGAAVRTPDADGTTALHWAAYRNDLAIARLLLTAGADATAANRYGVRPLSLACLTGNAVFVELLLKAGADPNTSKPDGETALMTAARAGAVETVKTLIANGANANAAEPSRRQTPLMWAAAEGHADVVRALVASGASVKATSQGGFTPLLFAAREGRIEAARALLDAGASFGESLSVNSRETAGGVAQGQVEAGLNAFLLAANNAHFELASYFLDRGANPNAAPRGWTALHMVSWVRKMGEVGGNDPPPEGSGNVGSLEFVRKLVSAGADINARVATRRLPVGSSELDFTGATPFFLAARTADVDLMRLLIDLGADPQTATKFGTTPLLAAAGVGAALPGEEPGTEAEVLDALAMLLKIGSDINAVDDRGNTTMHGAAYKHLPKVVTFLAESGARIDVWNHKNANGHTPFGIAAGIQRGMNFVFSPDTEAAIRTLLNRSHVEPER